MRRALAGVLLSATLPAAASGAPTIGELAEMSLEQLASLEVTSVSRRAEPLSEAAASIYVISADDIRRSGATSLPEALRLAPNLQVSQVTSSAFNIRARGVNNTSANKLLVLIDGRSVYTPLFSGVFWDVQDVMLADIERIEVISGPGGTLWGVNAVNGVINVITRAAGATQGSLAEVFAGEFGATVAVRHGGALGPDGHFRIYGKYLDRDNLATAAGTAMADRWHKSQAGFRADWGAARDRFTVVGNAYRGLVGQPEPGTLVVSGFPMELRPIPLRGANLSGRWSHRLDGGSEVAVQAYYDRTERDVLPIFAEKLDIVDLQAQHAMTLGAGSLVWGGQYRRSHDRVVNGEVIGFLPTRLRQSWESLFAQYEARPAAALRLTVGARAERNDYTGTEFLPSARLGWQVAPGHFLWTAASRAVRAPSRLDRDVFVPTTPPFLLAGGPDVRSEVARVLEIGYRGQPHERASLSVTVFHADYDHLHTQEIDPSGTFLVFDSQLEARTEGIEAWATFQATPRWRLSAGYTAQRERFRLKPGSNDFAALLAGGRDPAHTWLLRSSTALSDSWELDLIARGVAALTAPDVPRYATGDVRLGWKPRPGLELSLAATNLGGGHGEFTDVATRAHLARGVHLGVLWHFDSR